MASKQKITYNDGWKKYADFWAEFSYPWRPNPRQIAFYEKYLKIFLQRKKNPKILLLGSTPETRDLCSKYKLEVWCFEAIEPMYHGMKELMKRKPWKEHFIHGKWEKLNTYFKKDQFDIIFSDETQCNMGFSSWEKNFRDLCFVLKKDGLYFCSMLGMSFEHQKTVAEVFKLYQRNPRYFQSYQNRVLLCYELMVGEKCYDWKLRGCTMGCYRMKLIEYAQKHHISPEVVKAIHFDSRDIDKALYQEYIEVDPPMGEMYECVMKSFLIEDTFIDSSHPVYRFRRDMVLRAKKQV